VKKFAIILKTTAILPKPALKYQEKSHLLREIETITILKLRAFFGSFLRGCFTQSALLVSDDIRG
jgi:hypothetical protein